MLALAIKAVLPVVSCTTTDTLNLKEVLEALAGCEVTRIQDPSKKHTVLQCKTQVMFCDMKFEISEEIYNALAGGGKTLILVNQSSPLAFSTGEIPTPLALIKEYLEGIVTPEKMLEISNSFIGLTLKDMGEIARLAMASDGFLTSKGVMAMRAKVLGSVAGIAQVDTDLGIYLPDQKLSDWVALNKPFFMEDIDARLTPRGLLLEGKPGTGKSSFAKYIANLFEVPLYRLDLTSVLGRYVGDSESGFAKVLATVDNSGSCVLLIDEVEKLFSMSSGDSGVTYRILSQLLWWLQEHKSKVFTVMTTNDSSEIPPELYRGGRIDKVFTVPELELDQAVKLALAVLKTFNLSTGMHLSADLMESVKETIGDYLESSNVTSISHALTTQLMLDFIKKNNLLG